MITQSFIGGEKKPTVLPLQVVGQVSEEESSLHHPSATAVAVTVPTERPSTQQPSQTTWSASSSSWVTAHKWTPRITPGEHRSWWQLWTVTWVLWVSTASPLLTLNGDCYSSYYPKQVVAFFPVKNKEEKINSADVCKKLPLRLQQISVASQSLFLSSLSARLQ